MKGEFENGGCDWEGIHQKCADVPTSGKLNWFDWYRYVHPFLPYTVDKLCPSNIKVVAAMGDSITVSGQCMHRNAI